MADYISPILEQTATKAVEMYLEGKTAANIKSFVGKKHKNEGDVTQVMKEVSRRLSELFSK